MPGRAIRDGHLRKSEDGARRPRRVPRTERRQPITHHRPPRTTATPTKPEASVDPHPAAFADSNPRFLTPHPFARRRAKRPHRNRVGRTRARRPPIGRVHIRLPMPAPMAIFRFRRRAAGMMRANPPWSRRASRGSTKAPTPIWCRSKVVEDHPPTPPRCASTAMGCQTPNGFGRQADQVFLPTTARLSTTAGVQARRRLNGSA